MEHQTNIIWNRNMHFSAKVGNHSLELDSTAEFGGEDAGMQPKGLMMLALGGCTGMDVIAILKKMKIEPEYFNVIVEGVTSDEHPKKFLEMKVIYQFKGNNLEYSKIEKAVNLSQDKYCGVKANYDSSMKMSYEIQIM